MADFAYGVEKVHGFTATEYESLTSNFEFIEITTATDIRPNTVAGGGDETSQAAFDKLIQIVSERGQPVIMGGVTGGGPYVVVLAIEHPHAWQCVEGVDDVQLIDKIAADGVNHDLTATTVKFSDFLTEDFT